MRYPIRLNRSATQLVRWLGCCTLAMLFLATSSFAADLRLGIIGTDSSHSVEFTRILNDAASPDHVSGARVVAVFKSGSPDVESSSSRIERFTAELKDKWHLPFVTRIGDLCPLVDGILIESVDGRPHLDQFRQAAACGKPVFIDKPLASTLADAREIDRLAAADKIPWFSSSSLRFGPIQAMRSPDLEGAFVWGPGPLEKHHQLDLSWYAIHPVEMLFTLMGTGVEQVTRTYSPGSDVVTGIWKGGRIGTVRAIRPYGSYGAVAFHPKNKTVVNNNVVVGYAPLVEKIVEFVRTGVPPVPNQETMEIFSFMDAAQRSRDSGGGPISITK
ncbi:MAG: Gfo/Idh/MocA family oxidoreductase [Edaphobacter sp.]